MSRHPSSRFGELELTVMDHLWSVTEEVPVRPAADARKPADARTPAADAEADDDPGQDPADDPRPPEPTSAKGVHEAIGRARGITLNTIQSTLKRLFEKGLLERSKVGHAHVYTPRTTRDEFHRRALEDVVENVMGGQTDAMVAAFLGMSDRIEVEELERLEQLVAARLRERRRRRDREGR